MYWIKRITVLAFSMTALTAVAQISSGGVRHNFVFGPGLQVGLGMASKFKIEAGSNVMKPGAATRLGFSFFRFVSGGTALGATMGYSDLKSNFTTTDSALVFSKNANYRINARQLALAMEMNHYLDPYGDRFFLGLGITPALNLSTNLERRRATGTDTAFGYRFPVTPRLFAFFAGSCVAIRSRF